MQEHHGDGLPPGQRLRTYRLERELGRGGFGITYLAMDLHLGRQVAIKEYFPRDWAIRGARWNVGVRRGHEQDFAWGLDRFRQEARTLAGFRHRNVVMVFDYFEQFATGYIVMEFVDGEPLSARLKRQGTLDEAEIRKLVLPALDGLEAVHRNGLLHRDIKPANILLTDDGCVLVDFGSARPTVRAASGNVTTVLTPSYAALEQLIGAPQHEATDIYCLGAVLYHCVTGEAPPDPRNSAEMTQLGRTHEYSPALIGMISAALAVQIDDRPKAVADWRALMHTAPDTVSTGGLDAGLDPEALMAGAKYAFAEMKLGEVKFADFARVSIEAVGERVVPYLRDIYEAARGVNPTWADQMSTPQEIDVWHKAYADARLGNNAEAQYERGKLAYEEGDAEEAESCYAKAAEQGHGMAQYALAMMLWTEEIGSDTDEVSQAVLYCEEAARQGVEEARAFLDRDLQAGRDANRQGHYGEAEREYRRVAEQDAEHMPSSDRAEAEFLLARMYLAGTVPGNPATTYEDGLVWIYEGALEWFRRSAAHGHRRAIYGVYATLTGRYEIFTTYDESGEEALEAQQWYWKAAQLDALEQYREGLRSEADDDHSDDEEAEFWYRLAANRGHRDAQFRLGMILDSRLNCDEEGVEWLSSAATKGHLAAASLLTPSSLVGLEAAIEPMLTDGGQPYDAVPFADFVEGMLPALGDSADEIRPLLRRLYTAYRTAAQIAGPSRAEDDLSSDTEIDDWYARHQSTCHDH